MAYSAQNFKYYGYTQQATVAGIIATTRRFKQDNPNSFDEKNYYHILINLLIDHYKQLPEYEDTLPKVTNLVDKGDPYDPNNPLGFAMSM